MDFWTDRANIWQMNDYQANGCSVWISVVLENDRNDTFYKLLIISYLHFIEVFGMEPYIYITYYDLL